MSIFEEDKTNEQKPTNLDPRRVCSNLSNENDSLFIVNIPLPICLVEMFFVLLSNKIKKEMRICQDRGGLIVPADSRWRRKSPPPFILSIILFCFILGLIILGLMVYWLMIMITCICLAIYIVYVSLFLANSEAWRYILIN